tara:strand:- start:6723 stop:7319 length:597 start_codon:yes stop_codon:yes gene_type:complete
MIRDKNIEYKYKVDTIEVASFSSMHETDSGGNITPIHTDDIEFEQINSVGQVGLKMEAGELGRTALYSPTYIDWENDVFFRAVHANASTNTAHTTTWVVNVDKVDAGGAFSHPATGTLDTVIPADANHGSANRIQFTEWGKLDGGALAPDINDFLSIDVKLGALDGSADTFLMALQIAYLPKFTSGPQVSNQPAPTDA